MLFRSEEELEEDSVTLREEVKIVLPKPENRENRNAIGAIDFESLGKRNNTMEEKDNDALIFKEEEIKHEKKVGQLFKE